MSRGETARGHSLASISPHARSGARLEIRHVANVDMSELDFPRAHHLTTLIPPWRDIPFGRRRSISVRSRTLQNSLLGCYPTKGVGWEEDNVENMRMPIDFWLRFLQGREKSTLLQENSCLTQGSFRGSTADPITPVTKKAHHCVDGRQSCYARSRSSSSFFEGQPGFGKRNCRGIWNERWQGARSARQWKTMLCRRGEWRSHLSFQVQGKKG